MIALLFAAALAYLPNPALTPGVVRPLSKADICGTKWGKDARHVTLAMKKQVFARYGIPWAEHAKFEVDHVVSRELGGADALDNLAPEPWYVTVKGLEMGAHQKDRAENAVHRALCAGQIGLREAQRQIVDDWTVLYLRFVGPFPEAVAR